MHRFITFAAAVVGVSLAQAPVTSQASDANAPAHVASTEEGDVFVNAAGMTLYTYAGDDGTPGKSQCLNVPRNDFPDPTSGFGKIPVASAKLHKSCTEKFPPLSADENAKGGGDWSVIDRTEGGKQWAYQGRPLYTSIKDRKPGDVNGTTVIGQMRSWRLAFAPLNLPPGLKVVRRTEGLVLATGNDRPLYTPAGVQAKKACAGCADAFKPLAAPAMASVKGDWSVVDAGVGRAQYAFQGKALYLAPEGTREIDITPDSGWQTVVYRKSAGRPADIGTHLTVIGDVYADKAGKTLYVFTCATLVVRDGVHCDDPGDAAAFWSALCGDAKTCAQRWHPYIATSGAKDIGDWSVVDVAYPMFTDPEGATYPSGTPRVKAWAYRGRPVYTYFTDTQPGDIWGHSLRWFGFSGFYAVQVPGRTLVD